jgi:hypothetical protein
MTYLLIAHITVALTGIISSTLSAFSPSKIKIKVAYSFISLTILSGTILVVLSHQPILKSCLTGLAYIAATTAGTITSSYRLSRAEVSDI